jgi:hypothetical protein
MTISREAVLFGTVLILAMLACGSCGTPSDGPSATGEDADVTTRGAIEVTARLIEVPEGAVFKRELYNYATILKYQVITVHRGEVPAATIYVGHYNPFKPRAEAADKRVPDVGGNLKTFQAGQVHRMALEVPIDDHYMGGIVNKYFGQDIDPIYWAVWTNLASP